jgi:hypothetical protein
VRRDVVDVARFDLEEEQVGVAPDLYAEAFGDNPASVRREAVRREIAA